METGFSDTICPDTFERPYVILATYATACQTTNPGLGGVVSKINDVS